jgi:hypothetical protein
MAAVTSCANALYQCEKVHVNTWILVNMLLYNNCCIKWDVFVCISMMMVVMYAGIDLVKHCSMKCYKIYE